MELASATHTSQDACFVNGCKLTGHAMMDGMHCHNVAIHNWSDVGDACIFWDEAPLGKACTHFDESVQRDHFQVGPITGNVWRLSRTGSGTRQVQQAFENASCNEARLALTSELKGHVWEALKCQHANHVIQKCVSTIPPLAAQFVIDELLQCVPGGVAQAARHRFGCRIIERLLEHCSAKQVSPMVEEFLADAVALSSHTYGNYVMQHLLEHCGADVVSRITYILNKHLDTMATDGFSGAVIGKALSLAADEGAHTLAAALLRDSERLACMARSRWGHLAVKQALQLADGPTRHQACTELLWYWDWLRSDRYGRAITNYVGEQIMLTTQMS